MNKWIYNMWLIHFPENRKELHENFLFPKVCCVVSLHSWIQKDGCTIKGMIPTLFRNCRPSAKGFHLIDTFSANTGRKPGKNLIPHTSEFCRTWTKRKHYYDTKNFREKKISAICKSETIFNKNNCLIICDIYRKSLSLSIENKEINKPLKLVWLPV